MKWELDHKTGMMAPSKKHPEDDINLMSIMPNRSGWIKLFQNRVNINSVGNIRYAKVVWFDYETKTIKEASDASDSVPFRSYILPGAGKPAGWIYVNKN